MINSRLVNITLIIAAFVSFLFVIFPEMDIAFSALFFEDKKGFIYKNNMVIYQIYKILPILTKIFTFFCIVYLLVIGLKHRNFNKIICSGVFFLVIAGIIGPGLVVNSLFKENFGRARPAQVTLFNGTKEFTSAFKMTHQCKTNCSFSSGHAAMGFYFTAIAYVAGLAYFNKIYIAGLIFGGIVGLSRIVMGGHFLSDVVVSAFIVLLLNHIIFILWQKRIKSIKE